MNATETNMLSELFHTGIQLTQMIGLGSLLIGVLFVLGGLLGGSGPSGLIKGAALVIFGVYLSGLGQGF